MTIDTYVCAGCPGAVDTNPGTQVSPVATIGQGIRNAQATTKPTVFVATTWMGTAMSYTEDVTMVEGISVQGRWAVMPVGPTVTWMRTAARGTLNDTQATGLKFPGGITRATVFEGLSVRQAGLSGPRVAGITITSSSPLLRDFDVLPGSSATAQPTASVGVDVLGAALTTANPRLEGAATLVSTITAGAGLTSSSGLAGSLAQVDAQYVIFTAGAAATVTHGVVLADSPGTTIRNSSMSGGASPTCYGFLSQGAAGGSVVEASQATGCPRASGTASLISHTAAGLVFDACGGGSGVANPLVRQSTGTGGVVGGVGSTATGAAALDGCNVRFDTNSTFTGASGNPPSGTSAETSIGLTCSFRGLRTPLGTNSRCNVNASQVFGGYVSTARSIALACDGNCAAGNAACTGSCGEVVQNSMTAAQGASMTHLLISNSSPTVQRNRIGFGGNGTFCPAGASVTGVEIVGSSSSLVNNLVLGGPCLSAVGVNLTLVRRAGDMSIPSPTFHSNTIVASSPSSSPVVNGTSVGVRLNGTPGGLGALQAGVWRNNLFAAGPVAGPSSTLFAFDETGTTADPTELSNNLFFVVTPSLNPPLYRNEGLTLITLPGGINMLLDTSAALNLSGDPAFVNPGIADYHLGAASPALAAGTATGAPAIDLEGDARPNPVGSLPDLGMDER